LNGYELQVKLAGVRDMNREVVVWDELGEWAIGDLIDAREAGKIRLILGETYRDMTGEEVDKKLLEERMAAREALAAAQSAIRCGEPMTPELQAIIDKGLGK
jgi:ParB-like chromosome segregation protein Spo0J